MYGFKTSNPVLQTNSLGSLVCLGPKLCSLHSILGSIIHLGPKLYYLNRCLHWVQALYLALALIHNHVYLQVS